MSADLDVFMQTPTPGGDSKIRDGYDLAKSKSVQVKTTAVKQEQSKNNKQKEKLYLDPRSATYQKKIKDFKNRNFLLPQYQDLSDDVSATMNDKVVLLLKH